MFNCLKDYFYGKPEVIIDFVFEDGLLFISVKNIGSKSAFKISITFDKPFTGAEGRKDVSKLPLFRLIEFMPPQKEIKTFLDTSTAYFSRGEPEKITAEISYENSKCFQYHSKITHNLNIYKEINYLVNT